MPHLALSAVGRDRPGIAAGVTGALLPHGVNIEDSQMAVLRGFFAMTLVLAAPGDVSIDALAEDLERARRELGLETLWLSEIPSDAGAEAAPTHVISVYGIDHPGIVHAVASALAGQGVSIADLRTRLVEAGERPLYAMLMEVGPEPDSAPLEALAREQGVEISVRPLEQDAL